MINIKTKNLIEYNTTTEKEYIKKYDSKNSYITFKSDAIKNIQFDILVINYDEDDYIQINDKKLPLNKIPLTINSDINNEKDLIIKISSKNRDLKIILSKLNYLNDVIKSVKIDVMYIINLERKTDRKQAMINKLENQNIHNYEFIDAVDGNDEDIKNEYIKYKKNGCKFVSVGHFACLKSHVKVLKKILNTDFENVLILEDDVIFRDDFINKISEYKVPYYDILYFGGLIKNNKMFLNGWGECRDIMGMYAYMVNKKLIPKIINLLETYETYCDRLINTKIQSNKNYQIILLNDIIYTNLDDTDTSQKGKSVYDMIEKQLTQL